MQGVLVGDLSVRRAVAADAAAIERFVGVDQIEPLSKRYGDFNLAALMYALALLRNRFHFLLKRMSCINCI